MPDRELRPRCQDKIKTLRIPDPFVLVTFRAELERLREHPVQLVPMAAAPGTPCGLWVPMATADYIFYERDTTSLRRLHIICHEAGHMLFDHQTSTCLDKDTAGLPMPGPAWTPGLSPARTPRILGRPSYSRSEEQEAETLASLILERVDRTTPPVPVAPAATGAGGRVECAFGTARRGA